MPVGSALPNLDMAKKLQKQIEVKMKRNLKKNVVANDASPLTALDRDKQFKKKSFLKATFGKAITSRDVEEEKEMTDFIAEIGYSQRGAIPDSYLFRGEKDSRVWMEKRGKANMVFSEE